MTPFLALRANDELVTVGVHVFWPCTNELEVETRDEHGEGHVKFGPRKTKVDKNRACQSDSQPEQKCLPRSGGKKARKKQTRDLLHAKTISRSP